MSAKIAMSMRVSDIPTSNIHVMSRLSKQVDDVAFLSWAKPSESAPEHIGKQVQEAISKQLVDGYSESKGLLALRENIIAKLARDNDITAQTSEIIVTVGAIEGLMAAILAVIDPGDEVILPTPTYSTHISQVVMASGKPVFIPLVEEQGFRWDIEALKKAITPKTKAILYCTPSNPTGTVFSQHEIEQIADIALEHNLIVITDEAYEYFTYDNHNHFSMASIPRMHDNVISCFTFTKSYAMTGWRIGYLHACEAMIAQIDKSHISCSICAPVASQYAAIAALEGPQDCIAVYREKYLAARDLMCQRLDHLSELFSYQKPTGSYLMFPKILHEFGKDSMIFCKQLLYEANVSTTPGLDFGPTGEGHLRMSFCVPQDMINKAFDRIEQFRKTM